MKIKSLVVFAVLAIAILCSAGFVKAQTVDNSALIAQLQQQIASLTAQLQAMIAQEGGTTTTAWCHTFNNYLYVDVANATQDVSNLQTALTKEGFDVSGDASGTFGDSTAAAVVSFQGKYNIKQTGTVGPITRAKLNSIYGCTTPQPIPNPNPISCTPNWQCTFGPCTNGYKTEIATDLNNCGIAQTNPIACSALAQACTPSTQPSITITSPNGGSFAAGSAVTITWNLTGSNSTSYYTSYQILLKNMPAQILGTGGNANEVSYNLAAGNNGGLGYPSFTIQIPSDAACGRGSANNCGLIPGTYYIEMDLSNNWYLTNPVVATSNAIKITSSSTQPTGGGGGTITPSLSAACTGSQMLGLANSATWNAVATGGSGNYTYSWSVYNDVNNYLGNTTSSNFSAAYNTAGTKSAVVHVSDGNTTVSANCSAVVGAVQTPLTITSPNGGENWAQGSTQTITWTGGNQADTTIINLLQNGQITYVDRTATSVGSYSWKIPSAQVTGNYQIQLQPYSSGSPVDSNSFNIVAQGYCIKDMDCPIVGQKCINNQCVLQQISYGCNDANQCVVGGTGASCNIANGNKDCIPSITYGCNNSGQCVAGGAGNNCSTNSDCMHNACIGGGNQQCRPLPNTIGGDNSDQCTTNIGPDGVGCVDYYCGNGNRCALMNNIFADQSGFSSCDDGNGNANQGICDGTSLAPKSSQSSLASIQAALQKIIEEMKLLAK